MPAADDADVMMKDYAFALAADAEPLRQLRQAAVISRLML